MIPLSPLDVLFDPPCGEDLPLHDDLRVLYGRLQFPRAAGRAHVIGNFVTTLDGVVSLGVPGMTDGDAISGSNAHDSMVMGLLRAASDAVIIGAGSLRQSPRHIWTPDFVYPPCGAAYAALRTGLGKAPAPLTVVVTASGEIDSTLAVFQTAKAPAAIVTTRSGARRLERSGIPGGVRVISAAGGAMLTVREILDAVAGLIRDPRIVLVEGGPHLIGQFFGQEALDELFLTLSPRLAGRDDGAVRPGLVAGAAFLPDRAITGSLSGLRRGGSHLFLRYAFSDSRAVL